MENLAMDPPIKLKRYAPEGRPKCEKYRVDSINFSTSMGAPPSFVGMQTWEDLPNFILITGKNGTGKSQLLDYISEFAKVSHWFVKLQYNFNSTAANKLSHDFQKALELGRLDARFLHQVLSLDLEVLSENYDFSVPTLELMRDKLREKVDMSTETWKRDAVHTIANMELKYPSSSSSSSKLSEIVKEKYAKYDNYCTSFQFDATMCDDLIEADNGEVFPDKNASREEKLKIFINLSNSTANNSEGRKRIGYSYLRNVRKMRLIDDQLNEIVERYKFPYRIERIAHRDGGYDYYWIRYDGKRKLFLHENNMSSGEQLILRMLSILFHYSTEESALDNDEAYNSLDILLLDEPDTNFDPELCITLVNILYEEFVKKRSVQVIMTTHRLDTVKFAADLGGASVFTLDRSESESEGGRRLVNDAGAALERMSRVIEPRSTRAAISELGSGRLAVIDDTNVVYTEDQIDRTVYAAMYDKLRRAGFIHPKATKLAFVSVHDTSLFESLIRPLENLKISEDGDKRRQPAGYGSTGGCGKVDKVTNLKAAKTNSGAQFDKFGMLVSGSIDNSTETVTLENVWAIVDDDGKGSKGKGHVLSNGFYSIECYLCTPLNLLYLLTSAASSTNTSTNTGNGKNANLDSNNNAKSDSKQNKRLIQMYVSDADDELLRQLRQDLDCAVRDEVTDKDELFEQLQGKVNEACEAVYRVILAGATKIEPNKRSELTSLISELQENQLTDVKLAYNVMHNGRTRSSGVQKRHLTVRMSHLFVDGLSVGDKPGKKGHHLLEVLHKAIFQFAEYKRGTKYHDQFTPPLGEIPAAFLPQKIVEVFEDIIESKAVAAEEPAPKKFKRC